MKIPAALVISLGLAACNAPTPDPDPDTIPEPQSQHTQLRDTIQQPLDKAREVEATQAADEAERRQALEDAGG